MALVLTTRPHDGEIHLIDKKTGKKIGDVNLAGIDGQQARLLFTFDDDIEIYRDVVYKRVLKEKENQEVNGNRLGEG